MSFISHTHRTEEHLWQGWAPRPGTHGPPKCVYVHVCAGSGPTAVLRIGAYEMRALDERRVERFTVCERERESRLNHSSTAGCNSPATETADIAAVTVCAALALIYMHAHTHRISLFVYVTSRIGHMQKCSFWQKAKLWSRALVVFEGCDHASEMRFHFYHWPLRIN